MRTYPGRRKKLFSKCVLSLQDLQQNVLRSSLIAFFWTEEGELLKCLMLSTEYKCKESLFSFLLLFLTLNLPSNSHLFLKDLQPFPAQTYITMQWYPWSSMIQNSPVLVHTIGKLIKKHHKSKPELQIRATVYWALLTKCRPKCFPCTVVPPLSAEDTFQDLQWVPKPTQVVLNPT